MRYRLFLLEMGLILFRNLKRLMEMDPTLKLNYKNQKASEVEVPLLFTQLFLLVFFFKEIRTDTILSALTFVGSSK